MRKFHKGKTGFRKKTGAKHERSQDKAISKLTRAIAGSSVHQTASSLSNISLATNQFEITTPIVQGDADNQRAGSKITLETLEVVIAMSFDATPAPGLEIGDFTRITVFQDKNGNGAYPNVADLYAFPANPLATVTSTWNFNNVPSRFRILKDRVYSHDINGQSSRLFKMRHKFGKTNSLCTYLDNTGTATGAGANQIYIFITNYDGGIAVNQIQYQTTYDLKYVP